MFKCCRPSRVSRNTAILNFQCTFEIETTLFRPKIQLKFLLERSGSSPMTPQVETWFRVNGTNPLCTFTTTNLRTIKVITLTLSNIVKQDCSYNTHNSMPKFRSVGFFFEFIAWKMSNGCEAMEANWEEEAPVHNWTVDQASDEIFYQQDEKRDQVYKDQTIDPY